MTSPVALKDAYSAVSIVRVGIDDQNPLRPGRIFFIAMAMLLKKHIPQARSARGMHSGTIKKIIRECDEFPQATKKGKRTRFPTSFQALQVPGIPKNLNLSLSPAPGITALNRSYEFRWQDK